MGRGLLREEKPHLQMKKTEIQQPRNLFQVTQLVKGRNWNWNSVGPQR